MTETAGAPAQVRILIADGSIAVRRRLLEVFVHDRWLSVVGEAGRPQELVDACVQLAPDVAIIGLAGSIGDPEGLAMKAAFHRALRAVPALSVIAVVSSDSAEELLEPVRAGARGVLLQDAPPSTLLEAIGEVLAGGAALDPRLTGTLFEHLAMGSGSTIDPLRLRMHPAVLRALSPREQEVLRLLGQGNRNKEIAVQLSVSVGTVKTHLRHIYRKLSVGDRTAAVLTALQLRLPEAA
jgi:DNA-binding NarL/FixJ family response regulator